ncbi:DNA polymerase III subunit gamma/tau [Corallococcus carmarthensis]|uniref:DNA polymerase III subunit gamma/tau n=1 Tax=Corallococcus carmarthensis TaxID=2316728 RepID=UPI0020A29DC2|nr:DNA polymerase III subunit gamma/tau [Corallococcus carmarthensis]
MPRPFDAQGPSAHAGATTRAPDARDASAHAEATSRALDTQGPSAHVGATSRPFDVQAASVPAGATQRMTDAQGPSAHAGATVRPFDAGGASAHPAPSGHSREAQTPAAYAGASPRPFGAQDASARAGPAPQSFEARGATPAHDAAAPAVVTRAPEPSSFARAEPSQAAASAVATRTPPAALMEGLSPSAARPLSFLRNGGNTGGPGPTPAAVPPAPVVMDDLSPSAARPLSFLRNGGGAAPAMEAPPAPGVVMDDLPPSAARPLSFLRNGGAQPPAPEPTPAARAPEPGPTVRITNMRKPEPVAPPPGDEAVDERMFPEEGSAEGCASGECIPVAEPAPAEPEPPEPEPPPAMAPVATSRDNPNRSLPERWRAAVESVKAASVRHGTALANGRLQSMKAGEIILGFPPSAAFHKAAVVSPGGKATVDAALASHFGKAVKLTITDVPQSQDALPGGMGQSLSEQDTQSRATHEKSTEGKVRSHASVRAILKMLGGEIEHIQVYEPERPPASLPDVPAAPED